MKQVVFDLGGARNAMKTRPPIYTKYYDLLNWILDRTGKFPKKLDLNTEIAIREHVSRDAFFS